MDGNGFELVRGGLCGLLAAGLPTMDGEEDSRAAQLARRFGLDGRASCWGDLLMAALVDAGLCGNVPAIKQVLALLEPGGARDDGLLGGEFEPGE